MKKSVIFLICLSVSIMAFGQNEMKNVLKNAEVEVTPPHFTGVKNVTVVPEVEKTLLIEKYLFENSYYPKSSAKCMREGTEVVQFTVTPIGEVTNIKIINSLCDEIDNEIVRVLKTTNGMWYPALKDGEPVAIRKEVAFMFGAHDRNTIQNYFTKAATRCHKKGSKHLFVNNNPKNALRHYNIGLNYMPNDKALLMLRGICHFELGNIERANLDWNRIEFLGGIEPAKIDNSLISMKGYSEMIEILANNNNN